MDNAIGPWMQVRGVCQTKMAASRVSYIRVQPFTSSFHRIALRHGKMARPSLRHILARDQLPFRPQPGITHSWRGTLGATKTAEIRSLAGWMQWTGNGRRNGPHPSYPTVAARACFQRASGGRTQESCDAPRSSRLGALLDV